MVSPPALEARDLQKAFGRTQALRGVSLRLLAGQAHGLVGENGAGKSTVLKILTGIYRADAGEILLGGQPFTPRGPQSARQAGIALVPQELQVVRGMSVADNLLLGCWPARAGTVQPRALHAQATQALARLGLEIDPRRRMASLSFAEAQAVVLARELGAGDARILILDEPTASLERAEVDRLFALLERMRGQGVAVLFVSHRLDEVRALCDVVTVLRDGQVVASHSRGAYGDADLARDMTGREMGALHAAASRPPGAQTLAMPAPGGAVCAHAGRVTGLAGLLGAGTGPLLRRGFSPPAGSIAAGIGYVPSERGRALVPTLSVRDNIVLPHLDSMTGALGRFDARAADAAVAELIRRLDVRPPDPGLPARALSGGNQQKIIFARWLMGKFHTLLLDEPTHGIDVAAKRAVLTLVDEYAEKGGAVVFASAELHELLALADDIVAMREGAIQASISRGPDFTEARLRQALGG